MQTANIPAILALIAAIASFGAEGWQRHTIDNTSRGADGARTADANGDGLLDIVTPWEEGGIVRLYTHPGYDKVTEPWPAVTVGKVASPEDAVFFDVDANGGVDVVSACEGRTKSLFVHWRPAEKSSQWQTEPIPESQHRMQWMFMLPFDVNGDGRVDLVAGGKNDGAAIGWFEAPQKPRDLSAWRWHSWKDAEWIMSIFAYDVDKDGDTDIVFTDRKGPERGLYWVKLPEQRVHRLTGTREFMFAALGPPDSIFESTLFYAVKAESAVLESFPLAGTEKPQRWKRPFGHLDTGSGKAVAAGDLTGDNSPELVLSCEHAWNKHGVIYLEQSPETEWRARSISGLTGTKFDLVELQDIDGDGDLDVLTCEERESLGVIWYENPLN